MNEDIILVIGNLCESVSNRFHWIFEGGCQSTLHGKIICQRTKDLELYIMFALHE